MSGGFFAGSSGADAGASILHSFRAGKLNAAKVGGGPKLRITADDRKGAIQLAMNDGLLNFRWMDRRTKVTENSFTVLPGSAVFEKIDTKREGDRVYCLRFTDGNRRHFFWMQEPSESKDEDNVKRVNDAIKNPQAAQGGQPSNADLMRMMQMMGGRGGASGARGGGSSSGSANAQMDMLRSALGSGSGATGGRLDASQLEAAISALGGGAAPSGTTGGDATGSSPAATDAPAGAADFGDEDAAMQMALAMSMADSAPATGEGDAPADGDSSSEDESPPDTTGADGE